MPLIKAFADQDEDLELIWLPGFVEKAAKGWLVRAATRGLETDKVVVHSLPLGLLPFLPLGCCYANGDPASLVRHGDVVKLVIPNVAAGEEISSACIPPDLFPVTGYERKIQRVIRYRVNGIDILVPTIELIRRLFVHNAAMANALMRPSGLMNLCRAESLDFHPRLHLHFTDVLPVKILNRTFAAEFAWTAVHPDGRRSWDSVATQSKSKAYVSFSPPPLLNSIWTVRWVRAGDTALILEILHLTGKRHPCDHLFYSHPSMRKPVGFRPTGFMGDEDDPDAPPQVRRVHDYVVDDEATGSRIDGHQPALPVLGKPSSFDREISITKVSRTIQQEPEASPNGEIASPEARHKKPSPDAVVRHRVRVTASVSGEETGATLPPIEFHLLEPADPNYLGELEPLIGALHLMAEMLPTMRMAMSLCLLKPGRAVSVVGHHRRPCLIATLQPEKLPPLVLMDVDHANGFSLSSLALRYTRMLPFRDMEEHIKHLLDGMVDNHGRWNTDLMSAFSNVCDCVRLPRVLRHRERMDQEAYWKAWAMRLIERFELEK